MGLGQAEVVTMNAKLAKFLAIAFLAASASALTLPAIARMATGMPGPQYYTPPPAPPSVALPPPWTSTDAPFFFPQHTYPVFRHAYWRGHAHR
jgi:hypothetical protein